MKSRIYALISIGVMATQTTANDMYTQEVDLWIKDGNLKMET